MLIKFHIPEILFGSLLSVAVFGMGVLYESSQPPSQNRIKIEAANQSGDTIKPENSSDKNIPAINQPGHPEAHSRNNETHQTEFLGIKPGEALLAIVTFFLWLSTRDLVKGAEKTAERQLRAYIMIDTVRIEGLVDGGKPTVHFTVKNFGATPATNVTHQSRLGFSTYPEIGELPAREDQSPPESPMPPGWKFHVKTALDKPLNAKTLEVLKAEKFAFYLVGEIRYTDAFGKRRETDFLLFCSGDFGAQSAMASYKSGNRIT